MINNITDEEKNILNRIKVYTEQYMSGMMLTNNAGWRDGEQVLFINKDIIAVCEDNELRVTDSKSKQEKYKREIEVLLKFEPKRHKIVYTDDKKLQEKYDYVTEIKEKK